MFLCSIGKGLEGLYKFSGALAALCLVSMALCVILSIVTRLFDGYVPGLTEIAGYLMGAANCLALAYTFRNKAHIQVTLFIEKMGVKQQRGFTVFALLMTSLITLYVAYYMIRLTYFSWDFHEVSDGSIALPLWIPQSVVTLGTILFAISVVHSFFEYCWLLLTGQAPSSNAQEEAL
ncbi:TRAP transporter small permease [Marinomonas ostreistagni]|uniref:TRAP transporter small permease n=1 Tax=Marinomonas ostreistagni TaxID=359209 RepID=UPI001951FC84|nr:TRAP transporter small permease [Marinomonas ostreistagni]MBM6550826.1 TRAP transporter small permease [Marinomonas ostreistagni]